MVAHSLRGEGFDASEDGTGRGTPLVHVDVMPTMMNGANTPAGHNARSGHSKDNYIVPVAFDARQSDVIQYGDLSGPLDTDGHTIGVALPLSTRVDRGGAHREAHGNNLIPQAMKVRRLTPKECERLQGFPDDYTLVPYRNRPMLDGPRYKMLGNSMAVNVMRWIGERIQMVEEL